jgi:hypothetical protein
MKLPLTLISETDANTGNERFIICDADGCKLGDYGCERTAINQMKRHEKLIKFDNGEYDWLGI